VAGLFGAAVLAIAWQRMDGTSDTLYRGGLLVCGLAATVVLLDITTAGPSPMQRILSIRPLRWLGLISYGLYLWHWPIFQYLHPGRFGLNGWALVAVRIAAAVGVAAVSYYFLELPVRRGALHGRAARIAVSAAAAAAAVALLVGTLGAIDPVPQVAAGQGTAAYSAGAPQSPRVMVVGDSVAFALSAEGLEPLSRQLGVRVVDQAEIGCTIMRDVDDPFNADIRNCSPSWPTLVAKYRPDIVLVLFGGWAGVLPVKIDGKDHWPCDSAWQRRWTQRLNSAVTALSTTGAKVVFVSAPTAPHPVFKGTNPGLFDARQDCSNRVLDEVARARPEASTVDLAHYVCPADDRCRLKIDDVTLRIDGLHFRSDGAKLISRWLVPRVLSAAGATNGGPR
jgi:hypothetical protein